MRKWIWESVRQLYVSACLLDWLARKHPNRPIYINMSSLMERVNPRSPFAWLWAKSVFVNVLRLRISKKKRIYKWIPTEWRKKRLKELREVSKRLLLLLS